MKLHHSRRVLMLALTVVASGAILAACGGDDDDDTGSTTATVAGGEPAEGEIPAGAPEVDQDNLKFSPTELTTTAGTKVYFKNSETALHTVTINGEDLSGNMKKNDVFVWTAGPAGEYKITCEYHPQMKATITVN